MGPSYLTKRGPVHRLSVSGLRAGVEMLEAMEILGILAEVPDLAALVLLRLDHYRTDETRFFSIAALPDES